MLLAIQKSYELLANYGCFAREICDTCGIVLGAVRFTRYGESEVYCSRECRGDASRSAPLRPGRPRKYKTGRERRAQRRDSSRSIGSHPNVEKTVRIQSKTKGLQTQKSPLSQYPLPVLFGGWNRLADEKWLTFSNSGGRQRHGEKRSPPRSASLSMPWSSLTREGVPRGNGESESPCTLG